MEKPLEAKNQKNPAQNKLFYPQVTSLGAAGTSKPTDTTPGTPGPLLVSACPRAPQDKEQLHALV